MKSEQLSEIQLKTTRKVSPRFGRFSLTNQYTIDKVITLLKSSKDLWTEDQVNFLEKVLKSKHYFSDSKVMPFLKMLVPSLTLVEYKRNETIFRQGDESHSFYIILEGVVSKYNRKVVTVNADKQMYQDVYLKDCSVGEAFGESAVINSEKRTYTINCKTKVKLMKISKKSVSYIYNNVNIDITSEILRVLHRCRLFGGLKTSLFEKMAQKMKVISLKANSIVIRQDEIPLNMYILKTGAIKVIRKVYGFENPQLQTRKVYGEKIGSIDNIDSKSKIEEKHGKTTNK